VAWTAHNIELAWYLQGTFKVKVGVYVYIYMCIYTYIHMYVYRYIDIYNM